jgi:subtilisin family serine protease
LKKYKYLKFIFSVFAGILIIVSNFSLPILVNGEDNFNYGQNEKEVKNYADGEIIVKYKDNKIKLGVTTGSLKSLSLTQNNSLEKKEDLQENNLSVFKITDNKTVEEKIIELESDPNVLYAEPNYIRYPSLINTNDTLRGELWGLDNTGQTVNTVSSTTGADIDAPEAWTINEGTNAAVIVAVIDTGVGYNHPDILANMWDGTNCKDQNGTTIVGGCNHGYDFESNDITPLPAANKPHGTHVSGTIAAIKNNGRGTIGVAPNAKIMAIKFGFTVNDEIKAINFAIKNGAKIINASFGGASYSQSEYDAMNLFKQSGGIFVAASGNDTFDNDTIPVYPASYNLDNIISVAATDQKDSLATFSDYGNVSVDVGAPGTNIMSLLTNTDGSDEIYGYGSGTSMAAPHVSGLAALIWGMRPSLTYSQVKNIILTTGDSLTSLTGKTVSGKRINAYKALDNVRTNFATYPTASVTYSDSDKIVKQGDSLTITANFSEPILDTPIMKIAISGSNTLAPTAMTKVSSTQYTYVYTVGSGDGISTISLSNGTNAEGGLVVSTPTSGSIFTVDNTAPTISLSSPSSSITKSGPVTYTATYTDANNITLSNMDVTLNTTGTVTGSITVSGLDNISREISISNISGDGTLGITIGANTASDAVLNNSLSSSPSEVFIVDNTSPVIPTISSVASDNAISYEERNAIHITGTAEANSLVTVTLSDGTNTKIGTQQLTNDGTNYDIVIDGTTATPAALLNGTITVSVTATDIAGNMSSVATLNVIQSAQVIVVSSGGGGGGGGGGGSYTPPVVVTPTVTTIPTIVPIITVDLGCKVGSLFSTTTGKPCTTISNTEIIPGCNGTSLFSSLSGKACGITNQNPITLTILSITKILKQGSNNNDVKELQKYLNSKGYNTGIPDGSFGLKTKKAVIAFQIANKLKGDGIVGPGTIRVMNSK